MNTPILYSFRRCPYAMRARWALLKSGLLVEWREVVLRNKPPELLERSPKGTVPVLITPDGSVLEESLAIMHWALDQSDPTDWCGLALTSTQRETIDALIAQNDGPFKHHLDRFKYAERYSEANPAQHRQEGLLILQSWAERLRTSGWLVADRCTLADVALWPFVRQWRIADPDGFDQAPELAPLREWLQTFLSSPDFARLMVRRDPWKSTDVVARFPADAKPVPLDQPLFHLALASDWHQAVAAGGLYRVSTRGLLLDQVGFIHASTAEQLATTYQRYYSDAAEVLKFTIDPQQLPSPLRADPAPSGELFPHLYGPLPLSAVTSVSPYPSA
ncbi:MAG: DUF952 domain-containing protein [Synechococcus sp.]|nr:DUF952 domain-containing protein [Synechococcus sp.]